MTWADDLWRLDLVVRPLTNPPPLGGQASKFKASFRATTTLLKRELELLDARRIVLLLDITDRNIRADGLPRADARLGMPAVGLSFESVHGPLRYVTGEYREWRDNLRAIALSMEALRSVDRYGVSKRGEQYAGWRAIPASTDAADQIVTEGQAMELLGQWLEQGGDYAAAAKRAVKATHPDRNPDDPAAATRFRQVQRAKEILGL